MSSTDCTTKSPVLDTNNNNNNNNNNCIVNQEWVWLKFAPPTNSHTLKIHILVEFTLLMLYSLVGVYNRT